MIVRDFLKLPKITNLEVSKNPKLDGVTNLNTYSVKKFDTPPKKNKGARFRRHPFKDGNMTIALSNYDIEKNTKETDKWRVTAFYGTGEGFGIKAYKENYHTQLAQIISKSFPDGKQFIETINNGFSEKIAGKKLLQEMYENQKSASGFLEPTQLIDEAAKLINRFSKDNEMFSQTGIKVFEKKTVPKKQLYALYTLIKIISISNNK